MCNWSCSVINLKQPREAVYIMELDEGKINKGMYDCIDINWSYSVSNQKQSREALLH